MGLCGKIERYERLERQGTYTMAVGPAKAEQLDIVWESGLKDVLKVGEGSLRKGHPLGLSPAELDAAIERQNAANAVKEKEKAEGKP